MDALMLAKRGGAPTEITAEEASKAEERRARHERSARIAAARKAAAGTDETPEDDTTRSDVSVTVPVPVPPFWGDRVVKGIPLAEYAGLLDERATFMGQWGLRGARAGKGPSYEELADTEGRPRLRYWLDRLMADKVLEAAVVYGYDLVILAADGGERCRFTFPRQRRDRRLCLSDFYRPRSSGELDVVAFTVVTMGQRVSEYANELFAANSYRDYLEVHGLSVQLTEALAEYWHGRVRAELAFPAGGSAADEDSSDLDEIFRQGYRGSRYSFGYPACPDLEEQTKIMDLLAPDRIGVKLSEEFQLHPEQSTSAVIAHHPEAKYFAAR
jgi:5-methyltetrahydrofolate--homocysteine methyltransferase